MLSPLVFFVSGLSALIALSQFFGKWSGRQLLFSGIFGSLAYLLVYLWLFGSQRLSSFPLLFMGYVPAIVTLSVCTYLLLLTYLEDRQLHPLEWVYAWPIWVLWMAYVCFLFVPLSHKKTWILALYQGRYVLFFVPFTIIGMGFSVVYLWRTYSLDARYRLQNIRYKHGWVGLVLVSVIGCVVVLSGLTLYVPGAQFAARWGVPVFCFLFLVAFGIHIRHPSFFLTWIVTVKQDYQKRYYLNNLDVAAVKTKLLYMMEHDKLFRDNTLNLESLATTLGITRYQLSQLLNTELGVTFSRFLQGYRVAEAQVLLSKYSHRTILSIALEVGFNSNTAFQTAFKAVTGKTPSEYRGRQTTL